MSQLFANVTALYTPFLYTSPSVTDAQNLGVAAFRRNVGEVVAGAALFCIIFSITVLGNLVVITAVSLYKPLHDHVSNQFILNLAIADLANALLVVLWSLVAFAADMGDVTTGSSAAGQWAFGDIWCSVQCAANYCFIVSSMLTLGFISVDRYVHVVYPFHYHDVMTPGRVRCMIVWTWIQGCVVGVVPVAFQWVHYDYYEVVCAVDWRREHTVMYVVFAFITCFIVPGLTMLVCYARILWEIRQSTCTVHVERCRTPAPYSPRQSLPSREAAREAVCPPALCPLDITEFNSTETWESSPGHLNGNHKGSAAALQPQLNGNCKTSVAAAPATPRTKLGRQTSGSQQFKVVQSMLIVVALFFMCMTPFCVTKLMKVMDSPVPGYINTLATITQFLSCAINPFIYGIFRKDFQNAFRSQLRKLCRRMGMNDYADKIIISSSVASLPKACQP